MSILADVQEQLSSREVGFLIALTLAALVVMWLIGVFRRGSIRGRERIPRERSAQPVFLTLLGAITLYYAAAVMIQISLAREARAQGREPTTQLTQFTPRELVLFAVVPAGVVIAGTLVLYRFSRLPEWLGFSFRDLPGGIVRGAIAIFCVLPFIFWTSAISEMLYQKFGYTHPAEHDLLRVFHSDDRLLRTLAVIGAAVLVPMVEEFIFRGHLQTIARRLTHMPWLAVFIASVLFAIAHPAWMWPPIFVLSICLGYVYERTGNLWASITLHALFNASSIILYTSFRV